MAYMMDPLGNVIGEYETEEERRRREEEAAKEIAQKVEIKTYGDGRQVQTTTQQLPPSGAQAFPVADRTAPGIQVAGPVSPDTFARMQQAESGNRDFDAQGRPIVSPAGAMFRNQVMPATAAQPGFGIRPAQSQTPEEYNRVGQEYYQAMLKKFGGDERAAAAAYNAGPGTVQRNMAANQGQLNVSQLPGETQGYLGKVFQNAGQAITNMFPSAQAGTLPAGQFQQAPTVTPVAPQTRTAINPETGEEYQQLVPVAPGAMAGAQPQPAAAPTAPAEPSSIYSLGTGQTGLGFQMPSGTPMNNPSVTGVPMTTTSAINMYQAAQDKPDELIKLRYDQNVPEFIRERAGQRAYEILNTEIKLKTQTNDLTDEIERARNGDPRAANNIAKTLASKEGSWAKMILLSFISPQMAGEEAIKLGYGNKDMAVQDTEGKSYLITVNAKGAPLSGISADGKELSQEELIRVAAGTTPKKSHEMPSVHGTPVVKEVIGADGTKQQIGGMRMYDPRTRETYVQVGKERMPDVNWVTTGQAPGAVYAAAGAKAQGAEAGAGYTPVPLPPRPGEAPTTGTASDVQRQIEGGGGAGLPSAPRTTAVPTTAAPAASSVGTLGGAPATAAPAPAVTAPSVPGLTGPAAQKAEERRGEKREERLDKYVTETLVPAARNADSASNNIKEQIRLFNDPKSNALFGLYNRSQTGSGKEWAIVRDIFAGKVSKNPDELSKDIGNLGLNADEMSILSQYANLNGPLVAATARAVGGAQLSDADRAAAEKLQVDLGRTPALGAYNIKTQQLFGYDMDRAKRDWAAQNQSRFSTAAQLDSAWDKEQAKLLDAYRRVSEQRIQFIKVNSGDQPASVSMVREAFRRYPPPQYDPNVGWRNLRERDLNQILQR